PLRPGHDPELAHDVSVRRLPPAALEPSTVELTESPALSVGDPAHGVGDRRGAGAAGELRREGRLVREAPHRLAGRRVPGCGDLSRNPGAVVAGPAQLLLHGPGRLGA